MDSCREANGRPGGPHGRRPHGLLNVLGSEDAQGRRETRFDRPGHHGIEIRDEFRAGQMAVGVDHRAVLS
jgi:hypothetical protein